MFKGPKQAPAAIVSSDDLAAAGVSVATPTVTAPPAQNPTWTEQALPNFTTSAFSLVKLGNEWMVAEIPLDIATQQTGSWIFHKEDGTKMAAQERFKISVAKKLFGVG